MKLMNEWFFSDRWQNKATSFQGPQSKAQRGNQGLRVQRARTAVGQLSIKKKKKKKKRSESENDNLSVCASGPASLDTAGVMFF